MAAWMTRSSLAMVSVSGTQSRRHTRGSTSSAPTWASSRSRAQRWPLSAAGDNAQVDPNALKERTHDR